MEAVRRLQSGMGERHPVQSCDFCRGEDFKPVTIRPDGVKVVECIRCGLAFVEFLPERQALPTIYGKDYFEKGVDESKSTRITVGYQSYAHMGLSKIKGAYGSVLKLIDALHPLPGAMLLEVGCATGEFLVLAREAGAQVMGVEASAYGARLAKTRYGLNVLTGLLEDVGLEPDSFDVAIALEVVEHTLSPSGFIAKLVSLVRPGGLVVISTPNYRMARILGGKWAGFQMSFEHLYFISDDVLDRMATACGLRMVEWYTRGSGIMSESKASMYRGFRKLIGRVPGVLWCYNLARDVGLVSRGAFPPWERFGQGHTLLAIFEKILPENG